MDELEKTLVTKLKDEVEKGSAGNVKFITAATNLLSTVAYNINYRKEMEAKQAAPKE